MDLHIAVELLVAATERFFTLPACLRHIEQEGIASVGKRVTALSAALLAENAALKAANATLTEDVACMEEDSVEMRAVCWEYDQANDKLLAANAALKVRVRALRVVMLKTMNDLDDQLLRDALAAKETA